MLTGTGGIADHIEQLARICEKDTGGHIIYGTEPASLLDELLTYYREVHCGAPSCFG